MMMRATRRGGTRFGVAIAVLFLASGAWGALPENWAQTAEITATSAFDLHMYNPHNVANGLVPAELSQHDAGEAWCVNGATHRDGADITFTWPEPVPISTIVYYGRTAWMLTECWRGYEVYLDDEPEPVKIGEFALMHGPQPIALPERRHASKLTLRFTSNHGGANPGASEIEIYPEPPDPEALEAFHANQILRIMPWVDQVDPAALRGLIHDLVELHDSDGYPQHTEHLAELERLVQEGSDPDALARLQRDVLLFDVDQLLVIERWEINPSHVYTYHYEGFRAGGGLYVVDADDPANRLKLVSSPEGQILDADLSYDGQTVLFSWRRRENEGYHLWTVDIDGSNLTQLTDGFWHDYNACWLPDGGIAFLSSRLPQFAYCWDAPVGVLFRMDADGSNVRQLSANYLNDFTPYVLDDGRIIYSLWEYVDKPAIPIQSLWTINPDGTGLLGYFGNRVLSPGTFMEARSIPGTDRIVCTMTGHNGPARGALGIIDRSHGVNAQEAITNITPDVPVPRVDEGDGNTDGSKQYSSPIPLDRIRLLTSIRGPVLARTFDGEAQSLALDAPVNGRQYFNAQPVHSRPRPPAIASALPETAPDEKHAVMYLQDVYEGLEPHVQRGDIERIRVIREMEKTVRISPEYLAFGFQFPVVSAGATYAPKEVLGEIPVDADGSAVFTVPAKTPIYFQALDREGRAVQRMRSFTHLMPGETHGCVGCHEDRLDTPQVNPSPAFRNPPQALEPPEWGSGGFDYARHVQPILDRYCIECHSPHDAPDGIDLSGGRTDFFNVSYDVLARENQGLEGSPYVNWIPTYNGMEQNILEVTPKAWGSPRSPLADLILNGHPDETGTPRFDMDETSRRRILAWIDLNVPYYGTSETAYPENEGCRRILPVNLDATLAEVAQRRCIVCHQDGNIPRREWVRITEPELNPFLLAPLAKAAGGSERCGKAVFESTDDPDYRKILDTFSPVTRMLAERPRMDMPGGRPDPDVCRDTQ